MTEGIKPEPLGHLTIRQVSPCHSHHCTPVTFDQTILGLATIGRSPEKHTRLQEK
jgi:hypothetical protein